MPATVPCHSVGEWTAHSRTTYANPFTDVMLSACFTSPSGQTLNMPAFYDGDQTWRVRFSPSEPGRWLFRLQAVPADPDLELDGAFEVPANEARGRLRLTPGEGWGFRYESGEPALIWGDTTYNLFGMAYCGADVTSFLQRRARQGFNLLRVRLPVSPFHPPAGYSDWQTRRTWPWGGSEQAPRFDQFNLDYFHAVDDVVRQAESLGIGLEMIMEAWGFEFPFNSRQIFVPEWEELWLRYLIARYDAFNSVYFWTPLNEYEYYPNGDWHYKPVADRWAMRIARWIKATAPHGHIVSVHNGPRLPPFAQRFAADPGAVDAIMFQAWGARDRESAWLAAGIEDAIRESLGGWWGGAVFAEYGYERNPELPLKVPGHEFCSPEHTRRATWRGLCCGMGVIHGFENSWGPWQKLDVDQPGMVFVEHARRFFTQIAPFAELRPAPHLVLHRPFESGRTPLALASRGYETVVVYLPAQREVALALADEKIKPARWFDPRRGTLQPAQRSATHDTLYYIAPKDAGEAGNPNDWVLVIGGC